VSVPATHYYTASSLDGFIADEENSLSWLLSREVDHENGPQSYRSFRAKLGAMAMGATTYEWIRDNHDGEWPYSMPCWVFTHRDIEPYGGDIRFVRGDVTGPHAEMVDAADGKDVWIVGGGDLVGQFADAGLLDEVWVQYAPLTLGGGAPLLTRRVEMRLEQLDRNGELLCAHYAVIKS